MVRQGGIDKDEYEKLNNEIASIASREENEMEDENIEKSKGVKGFVERI